ncbi:growth arrest and DNA damage-inducible proteins-interacting protein 1-like [Mercenaria mercenaria]|uniref:growth arrest and DNA damage-inducible proteins-interacting protein 1-like n=1 Tax=Mercenaria mercenaria TaxID=6596 RepID=UPI001E1DFE9C|nr:growth arrest and DNA damage-inducible proteins-interacting protein 1-like [Mercenaria mercenaria]
MAASMRIVNLFRGQNQKLAHTGRVITIPFQRTYVLTDTEDPEFDEQEYELKLAKIRDCSGLNRAQKLKHYGKMPDVIFTEGFRGKRRNKLRRLYAAHGEASGINPGVMYPSREELSDLWDIENNWTQSFQEMKTNMENKKAAELEADRIRYEKIENAMANMDKMVKQYLDKQKKTEEDERRKDQTDTLLEEFKEQYGFNVRPDSVQFKTFKRMKSEEQKLLKSKQKKEEKKASSLKNLQKVLEKEASSKS